MSGNLKLNTALGGSVALAPENTASNITVTVPATTGTLLTTATAGVPIDGPAFSAFLSPTSQSVSSGTWTKVTLNNEEFDTNSNFDSTTNYRFTPTIAGYYQINASVQLGATGNTISLAQVAIYKNGSQYKVGGLYYSTSANQSQVDLQVCSIVYLNGSTDYVELYGFNTSTTPTFLQGSANTWFNGCLVRSAT
jgi:hypothetical protein